MYLSPLLYNNRVERTHARATANLSEESNAGGVSLWVGLFFFLGGGGESGGIILVSRVCLFFSIAISVEPLCGHVTSCW